MHSFSTYLLTISYVHISVPSTYLILIITVWVRKWVRRGEPCPRQLSICEKRNRDVLLLKEGGGADCNRWHFVYWLTASFKWSPAVLGHSPLRTKAGPVWQLIRSIFQMFKPCDSVIQFLEICPQELIRNLVKDLCTKMFTHSLFIQLKFWKWPKCSTNSRITVYSTWHVRGSDSVLCQY